MPKKCYCEMRISAKKQEMIDKANRLIVDYSAQGYALTLRQLYYQFVARDWLPAEWADTDTGSTNNQRSYDKLGVLISDARLCGLIDWEAIEDRTREVSGNAHWQSPSDIIRSSKRSFAIDKWSNQTYRVEVWVEKDALEGVVGKAARALDIQYFSCRGYTSQTAMWEAGQRLKAYAIKGQVPVILHLGDHDPSGIDMSRDIRERLQLFMDGRGHALQFKRIALNRDQIKQYNPPPNPAKATDVRYKAYKEKYGDESWELDALDPAIIDRLVTDNAVEYRDDTLYEAKLNEESEMIELLGKASSRWREVAEFLRND